MKNNIKRNKQIALIVEGGGFKSAFTIFFGYNNPTGESICIPNSSLIISDPIGIGIGSFVIHHESACP